MSAIERAILWLLTVGGVMLIIAVEALAQAIPHNTKDPKHWYPQSCCSLNDCEPVKVDFIEETSDGWHVRYVSDRMGEIDEFIKRGNERHSQDGGFHGCWRRSETAKNKRTICWFVPVNS
jgi:hypothetical protein